MKTVFFVAEGSGCIFAEHWTTEFEYNKDSKVILEILSFLCQSRRRVYPLERSFTGESVFLQKSPERLASQGEAVGETIYASVRRESISFKPLSGYPPRECREQ